ncbi:MAG: hypothetical protein CSA26_06625 [Desulfobacterales bacterium]|nr:MAG: hypothetical protein CSA26_06625 [Desulfobacterales bacterium]
MYLENRHKTHLLPLLLILAFIAGFYPALELFAEKWMESDDYTHAFFTVPIIGYMLWQRQDFFKSSKGNLLFGIPLTLLSLLLYYVSLELQVPTIIFLATIITILTIFICLTGFRFLIRFFIPVILLFLLIPIPNQLMSMLTATLQLKVSVVSEFVIRLFNVPIFRDGNVLNIPGKTFLVAEACSGIRSLISMTTLSLLLGYFTLNKNWTRALLFFFSIPVAIIINIFRVVTLVLAYYFFTIDLTTDTPHTLLGLVVFALGLALLFIFQRILEWLETRKQKHISF